MAAPSSEPLLGRRPNAAATGMMTRSRKQYGDQATAFAGTLAVAVTAVVVLLDLATWVQLDIAGIYGIPLVVAAFAHDE